MYEQAKLAGIYRARLESTTALVGRLKEVFSTLAIPAFESGQLAGIIELMDMSLASGSDMEAECLAQIERDKALADNGWKK